jgi:hypothetical protein
MVDANKNGIDDSLEKTSGTNPYAAPSVGGGNSYPAQGTLIFRPGVVFTDPKTGKKTDVTGKMYSALYQISDGQVWQILGEQIKSLSDQNQVKALLIQGGQLSKSDFQTAYWSKADTDAFKKLLGEANADGGRTWQEKLAAIGSGGGGEPKTTVQRVSSISTREEAEAIVQNALRAKLGRDPRDAEFKQLLQTLTSAEKANPSITTQTQTSPGQYSTTTTGGLSMVGKGQVIENAIMDNPELETEAVNKTLNSYGDVIAKIAGVR